MPKLSRLLDDLSQTNNLNLLHESVRGELKAYLEDIAAHAPVIHLSFAADPSSASLQKVVVWLRENIRSDVLVRVGLQPAIVAGCVVRTTNHYFDFSLKHYLDQNRDRLVGALTKPAEEATDG